MDMLIKKSSKNQIAIPGELLKKAGLSAGDQWFDINYFHGGFLLKPMVIEEKLSPEEIEKLERWARKREKGDRAFRSDAKATAFLKARLKKS